MQHFQKTLNIFVPSWLTARRMVNIKSRRGVANSVFTVVALPFLLLVIGMIVYFGRWLYVRGAVHDAAASGARWAVTSLGGEQGCNQAKSAVREVLRRHQLDASRARISVQPQQVRWGRGFEAQISVSYSFMNRDAWVIGPMLGDSTATSNYIVRIDDNNSRWNYGWLPCK